MLKNVLITAIVGAGLHVGVGWEWTLVAAIAGGMLSVQRGWLTGALALGLSWGAVLLGSYLLAPDASAVLLGILDALIGGNTNGAIAVACTLLFGGLLGLCGGVIGSQIRSVIWQPAASDG